MDAVVVTPRLVLRRFGDGDLEDLVELHNDPEVMHYINAGAPVPREVVATEELPAFRAFDAQPGGYGFLAAVDAATDSFLGWFHLRPGQGAGPREPELGYRLHRRAWGRGLATEGSLALVDRAFRDLGAERVYAQTMAVHLASRRVMQKAGLRYVRTFHADWPVRIPGDEHGDVEYALKREHWEPQREAA